jgi:protein SCO1/2
MDRRSATPVAVLAAAFAAALGAGTARAAPPGSPWGANYFPNVPLVTADGRTVLLYDDLIKDKQVVFSFIYTNCTKQCGPMTANLARVQRLLGDRVGRDVFFYSISMDPERDTPEVLREYAKAYKAGPGWTFLTGKKEDVALIRRKFGDMNQVEEHAARLSVGNDRIGQWMSTAALDDPRYLATVVGDWLDPEWGKKPAGKSYAEAPTIAKPTQAALTWRSKCASCHTADGRSVGPSLVGVTERRSREWLVRWITAPEAMLAAKDPAALELVGRYGGVVMPNLDVTEADAAALVDHMRTLKAPENPPKPVTMASGDRT